MKKEGRSCFGCNGFHPQSHLYRPEIVFSPHFLSKLALVPPVFLFLTVLEHRSDISSLKNHYTMGQAISSLINGLDNQEEKKKEAEDALNSLMTMAEDKATIHYANVINDALDAKLLPVHKVITKMQQINCGVSKSSDGLKTNIESSIKNFVKGEIVCTSYKNYSKLC